MTRNKWTPCEKMQPKKEGWYLVTKATRSRLFEEDELVVDM